jgi:ribosomal protein S12 methylthiotransferase accessory factor
MIGMNEESMMMRMEIGFPGNKKIDAKFKDFTVKTDQPIAYGGENTAPAPFDLFLVSLGTCAGIYIKNFCSTRNIPTDNMRIIQEAESGTQKGQLGKIKLEIQVPPDFPEQYKSALINAANLCAVKKTIQNPPEFEIKVKTI